MAVDITAAWIDAGSDDLPKYSGEEYRALWSLLFKRGPRPLTAAEGIIEGMEAKTAGQAVTVSPGACVITSTSLGSFVCVVSSQARLPVGAAHATYTRKDLLVARVNPTGTGRGGVLDIVEGTASTSPQAPTPPLHSLVLGTLTVPPRGAISLTVTAPKTGPAGGAAPRVAALGRGATTGTVTYVGDETRGTVEIAVQASGTSPILAEGLPEHVTGSAFLVSTTGQWWPLLVAGGQARIQADAPRGTEILGAIPVITA